MINYLRRLLPKALLAIPMLIAVPVVVDYRRVQLVLSGAVPTSRLAVIGALVITLSFVASASLDWEQRLNARKSSRR